MRIEMLLPSLPRAGMETVTATLAKGLVERGHEVGFTCTEPPGELGLQLRDEGFRVAEVAAPGLRPNLDGRALGGWLRTVGPDVAHAHSGLWLKAAQGARHAGVPRVVLTLHGIAPSEPRLLRHYNRLAAWRADRLVAVSPSLQRYLVERVRVPPHKVRVIMNGVPVDHFRPGQRSAGLRRALRIPEDAPVVGNVARLHPVKNHELLVDAFARVRERVPRAVLLLVGDGPLRGALEDRIARRGLAPHVRITGVVPDSMPYLREMDVFVLSSHIEGLSISLLEAMACEVPVVATAVGGNPALLRDGEYGALAPPGDADTLAAAIADALTDPAPRRAAALAAREAVETHYSVARMVDAYEDVYGFQRAVDAAGLEGGRLVERR